MKRVFYLLALFLILIFSLSCSADKKGEKPPHLSDYRESALKYFPLSVGNNWKYRVNYFGSVGEIDVKIVASDGNWFMDNRGGKFMADRRGIRDERRYILMFPLQRESWVSIVDAQTREIRKTIGVDESVSTPAGNFNGAIKVHTYVAVSSDKALHSFHYFVAKVGVVKIETAIEDIKENRLIPQTLTELVSYSLNGSEGAQNEQN